MPQRPDAPRRRRVYSCLAPVDKNHVGVLYESQGALNFLKIPYKEVLNAGSAR